MEHAATQKSLLMNFFSSNKLNFIFVQFMMGTLPATHFSHSWRVMTVKNYAALQYADLLPVEPAYKYIWPLSSWIQKTLQSAHEKKAMQQRE